MALVLEIGSLLALALAPAPQRAIPSPTPGRIVQRPPEPPAAWYSGDTHEHVQLCAEAVLTMEEVLAHMQDEDLNVSNVLIWDRPNARFTELACRVTGEPDPLSTGLRVLQYGIETSGLDCARWGHLIALGVGPERARIATGAVEDGDCDDMNGLGLGCEEGDGTGTLNGLVARHFLGAPGVVTGYAHTAWTDGLYHVDGFDWQNELVATGFTTDARVLDPLQKLAMPDLELLGLVPHTLHEDGSLRAFLPLLGPMDAVLGNVQFVETIYLGTIAPISVTPPASWTGLYYKLLSAGIRVGLSGGSDRACPTPLIQEHPRTHVFLDELSYPAWIEGLAAGRTTIGVPGIRVEVEAGGVRVGGEVEATSTTEIPVTAEVHSDAPLTDVVELVVDGEVREQLSVSLPSGGSTGFSFSGLILPESAWIAVRLGSQRAHTGAIWILVDGQPVADAATAEYWMLWCDIVAKTTLDHPELALFGCQEPEALALIADARRMFRALRDVHGSVAAWEIERYGRSTPACRGPIAISASGPMLNDQPFTISCVNAPPSASGELILSRQAQESGPCVDGVRVFVSLAENDIVAAFPAVSSAAGYAEVEVPALGPGTPEIHAQYRWVDPGDCPGRPCSGSAPLSASDALRIRVR
jgi:hypothetical protein